MGMGNNSLEHYNYVRRRILILGCCGKYTNWNLFIQLIRRTHFHIWLEMTSTRKHTPIIDYLILLFFPFSQFFIFIHYIG